MKKLFLMLCLFIYVFSFENSLEKAVKPYIIKENDLYRILCINNYEFILFKFGKTEFQQFFEKESSKTGIVTAPVKCKAPENN